MTQKQKKELKKRLGFEAWRDRAFSLIVPGVLIYLLVTDGHHPNLKLIALIILTGFATGQAAMILKSIANSVAAGILNNNEGTRRDSNNSSDFNGDRNGNDNTKTN
jgi:hypothetical protein